MNFFRRAKDGGPYSTVTGYWLIEIKWLFSIALLRFGNGSREEYHSHAFNSVSWLLSGFLREEHRNGKLDIYRPGLRPIVTRRNTFHRVFSFGTSWVLTFRGPWALLWEEFDARTQEYSCLTHGREVIALRSDCPCGNDRDWPGCGGAL